MKFKALLTEYRTYRTVTLWFDIGAISAAISGWVALAFCLSHQTIWGVVTAILSILLSLRFQAGLNEKFGIIRQCSIDMLEAMDTERPDMTFRHDRNLHNSGWRRFADGLLFGASYLAPIAAIVVAIVR